MIIINFSHYSQTYSNHIKSQCLVNITNFINIKNHFNHVLVYFHFLIRCNI
jgi:hypothetical protein